MKLHSIELTNFRCFENLKVVLQPRLTVFVSENGAGKTAILDAIAVGLGAFFSRLPKVSGINFKQTDFRIQSSSKPYMRIKMTANDDLKWDRTEKSDRLKKTNEKIPSSIGLRDLHNYIDQLIQSIGIKQNEKYDNSDLPIIAYYGTERALIHAPQRRRNFRKEFNRFQAYEGGLESKANFRRYFEWFYYMEDLERREITKRKDWNYQQPELKAVRKAITTMMSHKKDTSNLNSHESDDKWIECFENPRTEMRPLRFVIDWHKSDEPLKGVRIEQLSDGYRTTLAMVMDIAARMAEANPDKDDILKTPGIILIDEIDLHLHPAWQQRIIPDLKRTFPEVQFIVTTHSPQVISTIPSESIYILSEGNIYSAPAGTQGAEASRILKRVFGVDPRPKHDETAQLLQKYLDLVYTDKWMTGAATALRTELDQKFYSEEPALAEADVFIQNRMWEIEDEGR